MTDHLRIEGWVTPRLEAVLRRAVEIAGDGRWLGVEHVVLAIIAEGRSMPMAVWDGEMTPERWREAITAALPAPDVVEGAVLLSVSGVRTTSGLD